MNEERWHNFAKEKPSEDMEGRNFIVSNGHYEKIATWCGYWENEPFMGDHLCDEVVRWKFYFTLEEEKANESTNTDEMAGFLQLEEECGGGDLRNYIAELKQKLEDVQASAYAEMVDAWMRERRLKRALWLAREWRAWCEGQFWFVINGDEPRDVYHLIVTKRIHRTPTEWIDY